MTQRERIEQFLKDAMAAGDWEAVENARCDLDRIKDARQASDLGHCNEDYEDECYCEDPG
jgi:hypothetical protein